MSIHIGQTPLYQPSNTIIDVFSNRSNAMRLNSTSSNIYINMGGYRVGQTSNIAEQYFVIEDTVVNTEIIKFSKDAITLLKPLNATQSIELANSLIINSNLFGKEIATCNLTILNGQTGLPSMNLYSSGDLYISGNVGIGMSPNSNYALAIASNVLINKSLYSSNIYTAKLSTNIPSGRSSISLNSNTISLDADIVNITNLNIIGDSAYDRIRVSNRLDVDGIILASNVVITNKTVDETPLTIKQKRIGGQFANTVPLRITSDFDTLPDTLIAQVSPYGHVVLGGIPQPTDYMLRGRILGFRDNFFDGFINFTNSNIDRDSFTVNKNTFMSIGNPNTTAMFELRNNYIGTEQFYRRPTSMIELNNCNQNLLPVLTYKVNNVTDLQITSNASLVFHNEPINMYKYDIETSNTVFLNSIETNSIRGYSSNSINFGNNTLTQINDIRANNATMSNVYIYTLTVDDIITDSLACFETLNDPEELRILSTKTLINSSNVVINRSSNFFSAAETSNLSSDVFRIYSGGAVGNAITTLHSIGTNADIIHRITNTTTTTNSKVTTDYSVNQNLFKIGVTNKNATPNTDAYMFITFNETGVNDRTAAITVDRGRLVKFGTASFIHPSGYITVGRDTEQTDKRIYVKGDLQVVTSTDNSPSLLVASANPFVGINTDNPTNNLHVHNGTVLMTSNNIPGFSIQPSCIGIGTSSGSPFQVSLRSTFTQEVSFTSNVSIAGRLDTLGNVASTSDKTVKTELRVIDHALDKLEQLNGYLYRRIDTGNYETGLLAQEVKTVLPEAVYQADNGMYSLAYGNMAGLFVEAIKDLKHRLEKIEQHLSI